MNKSARSQQYGDDEDDDLGSISYMSNNMQTQSMPKQRSARQQDKKQQNKKQQVQKKQVQRMQDNQQMPSTANPNLQSNSIQSNNLQSNSNIFQQTYNQNQMAPSLSKAPKRKEGNQSQKAQSKDTQIMLAQKAIGYWEPSDVCTLLSISLTQLSEKNPASSAAVSEEIRNQLWSTAVVIAYLNAKFAASKDLWELVETKAKQFLKKTQHKFNLKDLDLLGSADTFVTTLK